MRPLCISSGLPVGHNFIPDPPERVEGLCSSQLSVDHR
jgi:hypothetical protein